MIDPLHKWLGIPPDEQPPNHYRLLGIAAFENDPEVIDVAADKQLAYLHDLTNGEHGAMAERLSNQVSAARLCLLHPDKKGAYDEWLRGSQMRQRAANALPAAPVGIPVPLPPVPSPPDPSAGVPLPPANFPLPPDPSAGVPLPPAASASVPSPPEPSPAEPAGNALTPAAPRKSGIRIKRHKSHPATTKRKWWHYSTLLCVATLCLIGYGVHKGQIVIDLPFVGSLGGDRSVSETPQSQQPDAKRRSLEAPRLNAQPQVRPSQPSRPGPSPPKASNPAPVKPKSQSTPPRAGSLGDVIDPKVNKSPTPDAVVLDQQLKLARELYEDEYRTAKTAGEKLKLARKMYAEGERMTNDPAGRFALWRVAREIVANEGQYVLALEIIDQTASLYEGVDAWTLKAKCLMEASRQISSENIGGYLDAVALVSASCCRNENFDLARSLCANVRHEQGRRISESELSKLEHVEAEVALFEEAFKQSSAAGELLKTSSEDPEANQNAGRYLCLYRRHWEEGIDYLALGTDAMMRSAAAQEIQHREDGRATIAVADLWYDVSKGVNESITLESIRLHALDHYLLARGTAKGLERKKVDSRVAELEATLGLSLGSSHGSLAATRPRIISTNAKTSTLSRSDFAEIKGSTFKLGMGKRPDGLGEVQAGFELQGVKEIAVTGSGSNPILEIDEHSKAGFFIDYSTPLGYSKRVFLGLGLRPSRQYTKSPAWGKNSEPDFVTDFGRATSYDIELQRWAPPTWDGKCWFTVYMQNAGANRSLSGSISW